MRNRVLMTLFLCVCLGLPAGMAGAEGQAADITQQAEIRLSRNKADAYMMTDGNYKTEWKDGGGAYAEFILPAGQPCHWLYVQMSGVPETLIVEQEAAGGWQEVPVEGARFNTQCVPLDGITHFRLRSSSDALRLIEVRLFGAGELPADIVQYHATSDKADIMVVACHPDDDILWLGGIMPTYAGQLGMKVQLVYMTSRFSYRRCEAMDALWHCGVRQGPVFLGLRDSTDATYEKAAAMWGGHRETVRRIARLIREYRPEVVVTQDLNGEYGHAQHRIMAAACRRAVELAADPAERTLKDLPAWETKKLYIHLYPENGVVLDLERPLDAFGGRSAFVMAQEAFLLHKSQQSGRYEVAIDGPFDIRRFGLAYTAVGPDEHHDRLLEHVAGLEEVERAFLEGR